MRNEEILKQMNLKQKIAFCSGQDFWHTKKVSFANVDSLMMADGPHGLRKQEDTSDMLGINESVKATCFPTAVLSACSFDVDLMSQMGESIALEAKNNEVSVVLGPGVNIKRNPLGGRNFEYFSEDPYLAGKMGAAFVKGVQKQGIGTSVKHFALNNQEYKRFVSDSMADERTMREIYLAPFEMTVKEGKPDTVMCAYNKVNGTYCSGNEWLLKKVLRDEWGFDGVVITDWGAMNNRMESFKTGCDLCMPGGAAYMEAEAFRAVKSGELSEEDINESVLRILNLIEKKKYTFEKFTTPSHKDKEELLEEHYELAKKIAVESGVLLKNEENLLPVEKEKVGFIGYMAEKLRYQGSGSSHINPWKVINATEVYPDIPYATGYDEEGNVEEKMLAEAIELAKRVKVPIIFAGLPDSYESEGFDREHMCLPKGQIELIDAVAKENPNTVVVLFAGSVVEVPFLNRIKALLYMGLPGEAGAEAACELLFGKANPCGKLAETWPVSYKDCICSDYYGQKDAEYREGIYVGYRYYLSAEKKVQFPFGYGLSYTDYLYSDLQVEGTKITCTVTNIGTMSGKEVVQFYIESVGKNQYRPKRELKGFAKVKLEPGESKKVTFETDDRTFAVWQNGWIIPQGKYKICVGAGCDDIRLATEIYKEGVEINYTGLSKWYTNLNDSPSQSDFETLLGRKVESHTVKKGCYTMENTIMEMKDDSFVMGMVYKIIEKMMAKKFGGKVDYANKDFKMMVIMAADCSLSGMRINAGMKNYLVEGLLEIANGHFFKGVAKMMKRVN